MSMKSLGEISCCLRTNVLINREKGTITLSNEPYILDMLKRFNMDGCKGVDTPSEPNTKLTPDD